MTAPTLQDAGNIADVDLTLIYAVDKPTNSFVIGKYRYDDAAAAGPQPPVGGAAKPPGPPSPVAVLPNRLAPHRRTAALPNQAAPLYRLNSTVSRPASP